MDQNAKKFLFELLSTPSPSSFEMDIQKKWLQYVKPFCHEIRTDPMGNAVAVINPDAEFKILLAGHCDEIGFVVTRIDERGFVYVDKVGGISPKVAIGMKVEILGRGSRLTGVIGARAEHHGGVKDKIEVTDLFIDCGGKNKEEVAKYVKMGDMVVFSRQPATLLGDRISGRGLDNRTGAFMVAEIIRKLGMLKPSVGVYGVSTTSEETNMGGAFFAAGEIKPNLSIAMDVTFATDYPGAEIEKEGDVSLDKGPVLALGSTINRNINQLLEESAERIGISLQYELCMSSTGTDADRMKYTGTGVPVAVVSLPLRYMHSPVETVSLIDMQQEIDLLTDMVLHLTGKENLNPLGDYVQQLNESVYF